MTGYVVGTLMTGTTTEGILEGKPEEEQRKRKKLKCWAVVMNKSNGWIIDQIPRGTVSLP